MIEYFIEGFPRLKTVVCALVGATAVLLFQLFVDLINPFSNYICSRHTCFFLTKSQFLHIRIRHPNL